MPLCTWMPRVIAFSTQAHTALWRHQHRSHRTVVVRSPRTAAHSVLQTRVCINHPHTHQLREHPGTLGPCSGSVVLTTNGAGSACVRSAAACGRGSSSDWPLRHRSASASDSLPPDAPSSARNATCATVVAPRTTLTGRAATFLRRTCPSCAWPLQRGPHHPADPLLVPGGLLCRVKWTRGVRRRRGPAGLRRRGTDPGTCTKANPPTMRPQSPCCPCAIPGVAQHRCPDPGRRGRAGGRVLVHPGGMV